MVDEINTAGPVTAELGSESEAEPTADSLVSDLLQALEQEDSELLAAVQAVKDSGVESQAVNQIDQRLAEQNVPLPTRLRAVTALNTLGQKQAVPTLGRMLREDDDDRVRRLALATLERLHQNEFSEAVDQRILHPDQNLGQQVQHAIL